MADGARTEVVMKKVYSDIRMVAKMMSAANTTTAKKCAAAAPALGRIMNWLAVADLQSAKEMWEFALSGGEFTPMEVVEGTVTAVAKLVPPARGGPAFCAAIVDAADQCVEVLVGELGFKVPTIPQSSLSGTRGKDRQEAESGADGEDEEPAADDLFEDEEEAADSRPQKKTKRDGKEPSPGDLAADEVLKRRVDAWLGARVGGYEPTKGAASEFALRERACAKLRRKIVADPLTGEMRTFAVPRLSKDQFLEQNFEMMEKIECDNERAQFRKYVSWIMTLTEKFSWADVYDFDAQVRDDFEQGRVKSWDPIPLAFKFQYSFTETLGDAGKKLTDEPGKGKGRHPKAPPKKKDGVCDFFQTARGCKKGAACGFIHSCRKCQGQGHGESACTK